MKSIYRTAAIKAILVVLIPIVRYCVGADLALFGVGVLGRRAEYIDRDLITEGYDPTRLNRMSSGNPIVL